MHSLATWMSLRHPQITHRTAPRPTTVTALVSVPNRFSLLLAHYLRPWFGTTRRLQPGPSRIGFLEAEIGDGAVYTRLPPTSAASGYNATMRLVAMEHA